MDIRSISREVAHAISEASNCRKIENKITKIKRKVYLDINVVISSFLERNKTKVSL